MKKDKLGKIMSHLTRLRGDQVAIDYDLANFFGVSMEEVDAIMAINGNKFKKGEAFELTDEEREELMKERRFQELKEKPQLRWAFTHTGAVLFMMQLRDKRSVTYTHNIVDTYIDVICLRGVLEELSHCKDDAKREILFQDCNQFLNRVLTGDSKEYTFNIKQVDPVTGRKTVPLSFPPFAHPEKRYDPATQRIWLTAEEVAILQNALDDSQPASAGGTSGTVN